VIERLETVGVDLCVHTHERRINDEYKWENNSNKGQTHGSAPTQKKYDNRPVGADPCVRPLESREHKFNRRSIRLPHYDYAKAGYYFITITTQNREHLFGEICDEKMILNVAGEMVQKWYEKLEEKFPTVINDTMVIMPNHIHFVIQIQSPNPIKGRHTGLPLRKNNILVPVGADPCVRPLNVKGQCNVVLGDIIQWFKTMTTNTYIKMVKNATLPPFNKRIWQRNYYEHVVRDDVDYVRISEYVENNPLTWDEDMFHP